MARSIFFWANPNFRSANVLVFLTGVGFLSFSTGILTITDFLGGVLGDFWVISWAFSSFCQRET
jgi:hypothetical protein